MTHADVIARLPILRFRPDAIWPGLALAVAVALVATGLHGLVGIPALSPLVLAMLLGMGLRNAVGVAAATGPGLVFAVRRLLRGAIVLLGVQLTFAQVAAVGAGGLVVIGLTLGATLLFTKAAARLLGVDRQLGELIAAGTSICGASAVIACNTVTRGSEEDVAYAIATVTIFGSLSMVLFPLLAGPLALGAESYGLWVGASVHEVAQVIAGAFAEGEVAGHAGTVAKLSRIMLLAPVILALGLAARGRANGAGSGARVPVPWFVFGFIAAVAVNSLVDLPGPLRDTVAGLTTFLLTVALAAMGLETDLSRLRLKGLRPLALGAVSWLFISVLSLVLVLVLVA